MDPTDIANAYSFAQDAAANLEDLQATDFWHDLDSDLQIALCRAHAICRTMANTMEALAPMELSDSDD